MQVQFRHIRGHIEVYSLLGEFLFSADTMGEAVEELREEEDARCA